MKIKDDPNLSDFENEARRALIRNPDLQEAFHSAVAAGKEDKAREIAGLAMARERMKDFRPEVHLTKPNQRGNLKKVRD